MKTKTLALLCYCAAVLLFPEPAIAETEYLLQVGDVVEVFLWQSKDLSRDVTVQPNGKISYPLVGEFDAAGKTLRELSDFLTRGLSPYLTDPRVWLNIKQFAQEHYNIIGEIRSPGTYNLKHNQTLLEAISAAGGITSSARSQVRILRTSNPKKQTLKVNYSKIMDNKEPDIAIAPGDIIYVPSARGAAWNEFLGQILPSLTAFSLLIGVIAIL